MTSESGTPTAKRLAEEVRAAVARAEASRGTAPAPPGEVGSGSPDERAVRRTLDRARGHLTPSIPSGARLSGAKRAALRALRFVWRQQTSFNALAIEAIETLASWLGAERRGRERFEEEVRRALASAEGAATRRAAIQDGRLARLEPAPATSTSLPTASVGGPGPAAGPSASPPLPPGVYSLFEERFRGDPETIRTKQREYVPRLSGAPGPVLDVGCGRGEFLSLLAASGVRASGVDANPIAIAECRAAGLDAVEGDGITRLEALPQGSLGGVSALQVVEHWTPEAIFRFLRAARRALAPGGVLVAETINVDSLSAWKAFYLDPSHVRPVPAEALRFLAEAAGFADVEIEGRAPLPPAERLAESTENDAKLNRLLFGPQDYALFARVPTRPAGTPPSGSA